MAGIIKVLDFIDAITATRTKDMSNGASPIAYARGLFVLDVEAITRTTGSVEVILRWKSSSGQIQNVTNLVTAIIATGTTELPIAAQWANGTTDPIPEPSETFVTFVGDTSLFTARIYLFASD